MKKLILLSLCVAYSTAAFADYKCTGEIKETVPVQDIEFSCPDSVKIDPKKGVPSEYVLKTTDHNPQLLEDSYENLSAGSSTMTTDGTTTGTIFYTKDIVTNVSFTIFEKCDATQLKQTKKCWYSVDNGTDEVTPWGWFTNRSADKLLIAGSLNGLLNVEKKNDVLEITMAVTKAGAPANKPILPGTMHDEGISLNSNTTVELPKTIKRIKFSTAGSADGLYHNNIAFSVDCKK